MENQTVQTNTKYRWTILSLVFFATTINYLDRQVISLLKDDYLEPIFGWTESDYANIVVTFQVAYAFGLIGAGFLIDRIGTKLGYAASLLIWSLAAIGHAFAKNTFGFSLARGFLGISEAGNFPSAIKTVAEWFPKKERALATGIFNSGSNIGAIIAPLTVPLIAVTLGWQWAFIITGAIGLIWLFFWFTFYEIPSKHKKLSQEEYDFIHSDDDAETNAKEHEKVKWFSLLQYKQTWAFSILKFFSDPVWWFLLFWLPSFLNKEYGMTKLDLVLPIAVVYTMAMFGSIFGGWLSGYFIKTGMPIYKARKKSLLLFALLALPMLGAQELGKINYWFAIFIIGLVTAAHQAWSANIFTTVSDMFPKKAIGSVVGIGGMMGSIGAVIVAKSAGIILDHYNTIGQIETGYYFLFSFCALSYIIAWFLFHLLVPKMPKVDI
ncbi:MFS transporter [Flavobacterium sp. J27]|uniref:MFS transporter n=1 Tax=Flavobacterium sp. J27 TaxID=2060419 RepID=UPI001030A69B|nr:MFS transporter [Flavobacterium sp. J27]